MELEYISEANKIKGILLVIALLIPIYLINTEFRMFTSWFLKPHNKLGQIILKVLNGVMITVVILIFLGGLEYFKR